MLKMRTNGVWKAISDEGISREKKRKKKEAGKKKEQKERSKIRSNSFEKKRQHKESHEWDIKLDNALLQNWFVLPIMVNSVLLFLLLPLGLSLPSSKVFGAMCCSSPYPRRNQSLRRDSVRNQVIGYRLSAFLGQPQIVCIFAPSNLYEHQSQS